MPLETSEMNRYDQMLYLMHRWLDRNQLEPPGGPSQCGDVGQLRPDEDRSPFRFSKLDVLEWKVAL